MKKAKHAFGALENIDSAISAGKIDAYDILFVKDAEGKPYIGWVDKDGNKVIVEEEEKVVHVEDALPESGEEGKIYIFGEDGYFWNGEEFVNLCKPTDLTALETAISTKADASEVEVLGEQVATKAEVSDLIELEAEVANKVTAEEVRTMIKESEDSSVEIVEF